MKHIYIIDSVVILRMELKNKNNRLKYTKCALHIFLLEEFFIYWLKFASLQLLFKGTPLRSVRVTQLKINFSKTCFELPNR